MESLYQGDYYILRIDKEEKIIQSIQSFLENNKIVSGYFNAIGAINQVTLRYLDQPSKQFIDKEFTEAFEVTSLLGNVTSMNSKSYIHAHIVLGGRDYQAISGHLVEARVGATLEVHGTITHTNVGRKFNDETGLNLLDFE